MSLYSIISDLETAANRLPDHTNSRRAAFKVLGKAGRQVALAALPMGLSGVFSAAQAKPAALTMTDALHAALKTAHLQAEFYKKALEANPAIQFPTAGARTAIETIRDQKMAHVNVLSDALLQLDETAGAAPDFNFTVNGQLPTVFSDYAVFLTVAQSLEDAGVRATKGRIAEFIDNNALLKMVLGIHGAQARHASQIRYMRSLNGVSGLTPWVSESNADNALPQVYAGENNATQGGVPIAALPGANAPVGVVAATQAFDEPFTAVEAQAILDLFLA